MNRSGSMTKTQAEAAWQRFLSQYPEESRAQIDTLIHAAPRWKIIGLGVVAGIFGGLMTLFVAIALENL